MTQFKYWFLRFDNKKIAQWNLRTNEQKRIKNLVKSPRTILTIYYKYFCETDNMAQIGNARINQLINQADEIDDSIDTLIEWLNTLFLAMIVSPIFSWILLSSSLKSTMIFEAILAVIGILIWIQAIQQSDQVEQLYNQANHLRTLPGLDGDQNRWSDHFHFLYLNLPFR